MNSRRTPTRRVKGNDVNEEIRPQIEQVEQVPQDSQGYQVPIVGGRNDVSVVPAEMTNWEIRESLLTLAQALTTNLNRSIEPRVNVLESTMTSR